ncbi:MAG: hypothetical protein EBR82_34500 [Caulobacteraceae bacterium]|nr:hypothetical protein [Caulobacteraceae bacterium]
MATRETIRKKANALVAEMEAQRSGVYELRLPSLHEKQRLIAENGSRVRVVCCGRRFGKSMLAACECIARAMQGKHRCWWVAPTYNNTMAAWETLMQYSRDVPGVQVYKDQMLITYPGGGRVKVVSGMNPDNLRGDGLDFVVFDEAAYGQEELWVKVLQPALMDRSGSALLISSPNGMNWFYREYQRGLLGEDGYASFHFTTYDNPLIAKADIDRQQRTMSKKDFQQEIMALFVEDATSVFRGVDDAVRSKVEDEPLPGCTYVMGLDWGRKHDYTAISVWNAEGQYEVMLDRFSEIGFDVQIGRIMAAVARWKVAAVYAEENAPGLPNIERMQQYGVPVRSIYMTNPRKKQLVENFALGLEKGEVGLLADEIANNELRAYAEEVNVRTGFIKYNAPSGMHDDTVVARMLAYDAVMGGNARIGRSMVRYA